MLPISHWVGRRAAGLRPGAGRLTGWAVLSPWCNPTLWRRTLDAVTHRFGGKRAAGRGRPNRGGALAPPPWAKAAEAQNHCACSTGGGIGSSSSSSSVTATRWWWWRRRCLRRRRLRGGRSCADGGIGGGMTVNYSSTPTCPPRSLPP